MYCIKRLNTYSHALFIVQLIHRIADDDKDFNIITFRRIWVIRHSTYFSFLVSFIHSFIIVIIFLFIGLFWSSDEFWKVFQLFSPFKIILYYINHMGMGTLLVHLSYQLGNRGDFNQTIRTKHLTVLVFLLSYESMINSSFENTKWLVLILEEIIFDNCPIQ